MELENFFERQVRAQLAEQGRTAAELARELGIDPSTLSRWLSAQPVDPRNRQKIIDALNRFESPAHDFILVTVNVGHSPRQLPLPHRGAVTLEPGVPQKLDRRYIEMFDLASCVEAGELTVTEAPPGSGDAELRVRLIPCGERDVTIAAYNGSGRGPLPLPAPEVFRVWELDGLRIGAALQKQVVTLEIVQ